MNLQYMAMSNNTSNMIYFYQILRVYLDKVYFLYNLLSLLIFSLLRSGIPPKDHPDTSRNKTTYWMY